MGESPSARTERELSRLRSSIDSDLRLLEARLKEDVDPRRLVRRNPIAAFGALGSVLAIGVVTITRAISERRRRRSDVDIDALIARLGGRVDRLRAAVRGSACGISCVTRSARSRSRPSRSACCGSR
jgi:hypothetical protein